MAVGRFETMRSQDRQNYISHARLAGTDCFRELDSEFIEALSRELDVQMFAAGDIIMKEGSVTSTVVFLFHGSVDVVKRDQKITTLGDGSVLGELACLGSRNKRTCTVIANEFCDCRSMDARHFKALLKRHPIAKAHFESIAEERNEEIERINRREEKLARLERSKRRAGIALSPGELLSTSDQQDPAYDESIHAEFLAKIKGESKVLSPAKAPSAKPGSGFRNYRKTMTAPSLESLDTSAPSSRPDSKESSATEESATSSEAQTTLSAQVQRLSAASSISPCSDNSSLPSLSPSQDGTTRSHSLRAAMRAKNDALRIQLMKARADLVGTCVSPKARQIDASLLIRSATA
jgi:CRP-like cAMP-binding protein